MTHLFIKDGESKNKTLIYLYNTIEVFIKIIYVVRGF